jgi:hypothetical protein
MCGDGKEAFRNPAAGPLEKIYSHYVQLMRERNKKGIQVHDRKTIPNR